METPTPSQRLFMRNIPCLSRTPGSTTPITRPLPKQVLLYEWWLVKAAAPSNGKHLKVSGFTSRGQFMETFHSAPIVKRHGTAVLETVDGIIISTCGFINRSRSLGNGFSKEVCDKFLLGFPFNWEEFASASGGVSPSEENIRKIHAVSSCTGGKMTDCLKDPGSSCTGGKATDCFKKDASHGMKDSFSTENQISNAVNHENTVTHVVPGTTSSVASRVEILQKPEDSITMEGGAVRENMNTVSEKSLEGSCVDSASAGVEENTKTASEKCSEFSCWDSHTSKTKSQTISGKEGWMGSLVEDFTGNKNDITESEGNNADSFVDVIVPQSLNESNQINVKQKSPPANDMSIMQKRRGRPPANDMSIMQKRRGRPPANGKSSMRMTRSMKRQRKISLPYTSATTDGITEPVAFETPETQSHVMNTLAMTDGVTVAVVSRTPKKQFHIMNTLATTDGVVLETPKKQSHVINTSTPTDGVTATVVLETPKKQSHILLARCQVPSTSNLSKWQDESEKVEKSQQMPTLRRSIRLQNRK